MTTAQFSTRGYERTPSASHGTAWIVIFAIAVALLGGSSRFDAVQLAGLRPLAALFLVPALYWMSRDKLVPARAPLAILALMALWTAIQLVPLPPALWQALPGRETIAALDAIHGLSDSWRPVSWVPMRTWNALFALIVPLAAMLLALSVRARKRTVLLVIVGLGVADAVLCLAQLYGGRESPFYLYTHTNFGAPTGLFANENHSGVFSALVLMVIARLGLSDESGARLESVGLALAFALVCLVLLSSSSRAAFGLSIVVLFACVCMAWLRHHRAPCDQQRHKWAARNNLLPQIILLVGFVLPVCLGYLLYQFDRMPGLSGAIRQDAFEDLRWRIGPTLLEMIATHWMVGTGFGSFDAVYLSYEPTAIQSQAYVNQAHNDWAQLMIEGGLPAAALLFALGIWVVGAVRKISLFRGKALLLGVFWAVVIAILATASIVDYPLRTPLFQTVCAFLVVVLVLDSATSARMIRASRA